MDSGAPKHLCKPSWKHYSQQLKNENNPKRPSTVECEHLYENNKEQNTDTCYTDELQKY